MADVEDTFLIQIPRLGSAGFHDNGRSQTEALVDPRAKLLAMLQQGRESQSPQSFVPYNYNQVIEVIATYYHRHKEATKLFTASGIQQMIKESDIGWQPYYTELAIGFLVRAGVLQSSKIKGAPSYVLTDTALKLVEAIQAPVFLQPTL